MLCDFPGEIERNIHVYVREWEHGAPSLLKSCSIKIQLRRNNKFTGLLKGMWVTVVPECSSPM